MSSKNDPDALYIEERTEKYKKLSKNMINELLTHIPKKECVKICTILLEEANALPDGAGELASPFAKLPAGVPCPDHLLPKGCINNPWRKE